MKMFPSGSEPVLQEFATVFDESYVPLLERTTFSCSLCAGDLQRHREGTQKCRCFKKINLISLLMLNPVAKARFPSIITVRHIKNTSLSISAVLRYRSVI